MIIIFIVQPSDPIIYDAQGKEVIGMAGPFMEGYDLFLSCHVVGGELKKIIINKFYLIICCLNSNRDNASLMGASRKMWSKKAKENDMRTSPQDIQYCKW